MTTSSSHKEINQAELTQIRELISSQNEEAIRNLSQKLGLTFIWEKEEEGNLCFAENREVIPEFREVFGPGDLLDFIVAMLYTGNFQHERENISKLDFRKLTDCANPDTFWKLTELGRKIRHDASR